MTTPQEYARYFFPHLPLAAVLPFVLLLLELRAAGKFGQPIVKGNKR